MKFFDFEVDERELQYGRLASDVLSALKSAVEYRIERGATRKQIADELGWDQSQLSRLLNGRVKNLTLKSISDVFWATHFQPAPFKCSPVEDISPNGSTISIHIGIDNPVTKPISGSVGSSFKLEMSSHNA